MPKKRKVKLEPQDKVLGLTIGTLKAEINREMIMYKNSARDNRKRYVKIQKLKGAIDVLENLSQNYDLVAKDNISEADSEQ